MIAAIEMGGGVYSAVAAIWLAARFGPVSWWPCLVLVVGGLAVALAGVWLWRGQARGLELSVVLQALQLVQVVVPGVAFVLVLGPSAVVGFPAGENLALGVAFNPEAALVFWHHDTPFRLQFNVLAFVLLMALRRAQAATALPEPASTPAGA